ncbi:MAG: DUF6298 domain-containing protein [Deltaproteobacteria bacterium]|nr:DUF6298 domain-containing protein [Deltaproteobacteria bacterium]
MRLLLVALISVAMPGCHPAVQVAKPRPSAPGVAGPVSVDRENPRYFHWKGKPMVFVASTEHYGAVINPAFDYETYLKTTQADGLNQVRIFLGDYIEDSRRFGITDNNLEPAPGTQLTPWARSATSGAADGGNKFDLNAWDPIYWARLHAFMRSAAEKGIVVEAVMFFVGMDWARSPLHAANNINGTSQVTQTQVLTLNNGNLLERQKLYVHKLITELNGYDNVIFDLVNEPWFLNQEIIGFTSQPPTATKEWIRVASGWIRDAEANLRKRHVVTADCTNRGVALTQEELTGPYADLDGFNVHYDSFALSLLLNRNLGRPMTFNETGFQGPSDEPYLVDAWRYLLSGGALYGHLDYSFTVSSPDGTHQPSWSSHGYNGGGSPTLRKQLGGLQKFINSLPLNKMQPDDGVIIEYGLGAAVAHHTLAWPGHLYATFFPGEGEIKTAIQVPKGKWRVSWLSPQGATVEKSEDVEVTRWGHALAPQVRSHGGLVLVLCSLSSGDCGGRT